MPCADKGYDRGLLDGRWRAESGSEMPGARLETVGGYVSSLAMVPVAVWAVAEMVALTVRRSSVGC